MKRYWMVFQDETLTASQANVYTCLCMHQGNNEDCFPSHKTIAKETHLGLTTVKRAINRLVEIGYIEKTNQFRQDGGKSSNRYRCLK